ncbi:MAG: aldo/keto reductase [Polyangiaceae bacterium]
MSKSAGVDEGAANRTLPFERKRALGRSHLEVMPLGLAAGYGVGAADVEFARERGVDFFYWGSARRRGFGEGLRRVLARDRASTKLVIQTYARWPSGIGRSLERALRALKTDYADVLLLGWWNLPPRAAILDAAAETVARGLAKHIMVSSHHRPTFVELARDPRIDLLMLRYNAAHPGAERDVFPLLTSDRPGVVGYTTTSWGQLLDASLTPTDERTPTSTDCYRFSLGQPGIDACWMGARNRSDLEVALTAMELGPLSAEEDAWIRRVGTAVRDRTKARAGGMNVADRIVNLVSGFGFKSTTELVKSA